jgi:Cu/Ag efflux protein CusF
MKTGFWMTAACVAGGLCLSTVALCQTPAKPAAPAKGEAVISAVTVTATVTQIDHKTREVTLRAEDGQEYSFVAGDAVANLAQVQKGDVVTAAYTEAVAYEVKKGGKADAAATVAGGAAPLGAKPAAAVGGKVTVTVAVAAIDAKAPSVTFKGPGGNSRTVKVKDPAKLKGVSVGDTVEITYAEAVAIKVEKAAKK